jgi:hypothetical protein
MASEMTLSSEWKTSELRHVAIALPSRRLGLAHLRKGIGQRVCCSRSEAAQRQAVARLEEDGAAREDVELRGEMCRQLVQQFYCL